MGTMTAQILVGETHPNHGGISPTHYLFLSENSRPAWILVEQNIFGHEHEAQRVVWIPTAENMLEDALLMIAMYVLKDKEILEMAEGFFKNKGRNPLELYDDISKDDLKKLYERCREIEMGCKIVISVFDGSSIRRQVNALEKYKMDAEVCTVKYHREYSVWSNETEVKGTL
jgi:hypothetical protein